MEVIGVSEGFKEECSTPIFAVSTPPQELRWSNYRERRGESNSPSKSSSQQRMQTYICWKCKEPGHLANDCQMKTQKAGEQENMRQLPVVRCHCNVAYKILMDDKERRRYYRRACRCHDLMVTELGDRFDTKMWCGGVHAPMCSCDAGACTINFCKDIVDGTATYTKYYTCRIKSGHGACDFLYIPSPKSPIKSLKSPIKISVLSPKHVEPPNIITHETECPVLSCSKGSIISHEMETCNLEMGKGGRFSRLSSKSDIHSRQIQFSNQISAAAVLSNECKVLPMLGLRVNGWAGRLVFPPSRFLSDPPLGHFFCCIYPLFDPILVDTDVSDSASAYSDGKVVAVTQNALRNDTQLIAMPVETSSCKRSFTAVQEDETSPVFNEFVKKRQKGLVIQSMESPDNDALPQGAESASDALANLSSECGPIAGLVKKIIPPASRFVEIRSIVQDNCDLRASTEHNSVDDYIENIPGLLPEAVATLTASSSFLQLIRKVPSRLKDRLLQIEKLLDLCETQILELDTVILDMTEEVVQSKRNMQAAHQELKKALKLRQREGGQCMGKRAFEETCSSSSEYSKQDLRKRQKI